MDEACITVLWSEMMSKPLYGGHDGGSEPLGHSTGGSGSVSPGKTGIGHGHGHRISKLVVWWLCHRIASTNTRIE